MSRRSGDLVARAVQRFIVLPIILLFGICISGTLAEELFGIPAAATRVFAGVGGIGFLVYYYRNWINRLMR